MNVPRIRFKGFNGEWGKVKLSDVALEFKYGINAPAKQYDGKNKYLRITDIDDDSHLFLQDNVSSPDCDLSICQDCLMAQGDIVIARTGATVGKSYAYDISDGIVYFAGFLIRIRFCESVSHKFIYLTTLLQSFKRYIKIVSQRSGQPGVNTSELKNYCISLPSQQQEQQTISQYFRNLDSLIQATEKKIASLKQVKEASLQAMFPVEGETVPKVRFKGFEEEWGLVRFCNLYKKVCEKNDLSYGADKIISVANMYFQNTDSKQTSISDEEYMRSYNIMKLGDIAFEGNKSKNFSYGRFVENTIGDGIVSHVFTVLRPINQYDIFFWKYYINNENTMRNVLRKSTKASTMMNDLVINDFLKETIRIPSLKEQQRIGAYFNALDKQITIQTQRFKKLKQIKSACLDAMFV